MRENTQDLYAGIEYSQDSKESQEIIKLFNDKSRKHPAVSINSISVFATDKIVCCAFEYVLKFQWKKSYCCYKSEYNEMYR